jgi:hypothetical protein
MELITLHASESDDPRFVETVGSVLNGAVAQVQPSSVYVVRIDNWFGPKWLGFSGKVLGAIGVSKVLVTLPPFVPARVMAQAHYTRDADSSGYVATAARPLHIHQPSGANLQRRTDLVASGNAVFWISGNSQPNGRGCVMAHLPSEGGIWPWYVGFARESTWRIAELRGITYDEFGAFVQRANEQRA